MINRGLTVDLANELNDSAHIVIKDMKEGVAQSQDIHEQAFVPLKPATIKDKARRGMPDPGKPLVGTSQMTGVFNAPGTGPYLKKKATASSQLAQISAPMKKAPYGFHHQEPSIEGRPPTRRWFGVSRTAERQIVKNIQATIRRLIDAR